MVGPRNSFTDTLTPQNPNPGNASAPPLPSESLQVGQLDLKEIEAKFLKFLKEEGKSINTLKNYRTDLDLFGEYLYEHQGHRYLVDFNFTKVSEYGSFLKERYNSDNSKRRRIQTLRLFFDYLVGQGHFSENPVRKLPTSPKFLDIPRPTSLGDAQKLWNHLCNERNSANRFSNLLAKRNQIIFLLIFGSALKVSDLTELKEEDLVLNENPRVIIHPFKRDAYSVPLMDLFPTLYKDYKEHLEEEKAKVGLTFNEILFNANPYRILSGGISPRGLEIIFEDLRKKLDIKLTPKSLRQACIFHWLGKNLQETLIKEWMGVAPSYGLKLYKDHLPEHFYEESFLYEHMGSTQVQ